MSFNHSFSLCVGDRLLGSAWREPRSPGKHSMNNSTRGELYGRVGREYLSWDGQLMGAEGEERVAAQGAGREEAAAADIACHNILRGCGCELVAAMRD